MKKTWITLLTLLLLPQIAIGDMIGSEAPDFSLKDIEGNIISLSRFYGNVVMLFHFNAYCHTCQEEVPIINKIHLNYKDLQIIGIAIGNDNREAIEFKKNFRPKFLLVTDPQQKAYKNYYVYSVPLIDIIDRTGTIRYRGNFTSYAEFNSIMEKIIKEKEVVGAGLWNKAPDFTLTTTQREPFHLQDLIGKKTILLTFISVHNKTVRQVIEIMKSLYSKYRREDLAIVRVAVKDNIEDIEKFKQQYRATFPILVDKEGQVAKLYDTVNLPRTFIINKKGMIRYVSDQISLVNLVSILTKIKSYFKEELPEEELMKYLAKAAPDVKQFDKVTLENNNVVYIGTAKNGEKIIVREVFKDVLCDVCTNVHFVYSFDQKGKIKNIVLIESIDLYGEPIDAKDFIQRVIHQASKKLPLQLREDIDALTGATQSCKLILEGLNETPNTINSLNKYRDILVKIPNNSFSSHP